jgi:fatty-acid peroxygenase
MSPIPREHTLDSSLALLRDGYRFILKRCRRYDTDIFATRLMFQKAICMMGEEAAALFYGTPRFTRKGAFPPTTLWLLQDQGSVQTLDGEAHRHRKQMFIGMLMAPASIQRLVETMAAHWQDRFAAWERMDQVVIDDEMRAILCRAVCEWCAIPLSGRAAKRRTREIGAMLDGAGTIGPRNWWGLLLRQRTERWARRVIAAVRDRRLDVPEGSVVHVIASFRARDGNLLSPEIAAVELINVLRPVVAVSRFITFAALALHEHPESRRALQTGGDKERDLFVQEVRRFYPFFPFSVGCVRHTFDWQGHRFEEGTRVLLDLYGTDHDARIWQDPGEFRPERFRRWNGSPFNFIPQGGGDYDDNHRCPGEWITVALMKEAVRLLTTAMTYDVPAQDLRIDLSRMPAVPQSRFVITNVRRVAEPAATMPVST